MNSKNRWVLSIEIILASLLLTFVSGCSHINGYLPNSSASNDVTSTRIPVTTESTSRIYFQRVSAKFDGNAIVIRGRVGNHSPVNVIGGHIDAKLYGPDELMIAEASTYQSPRIIRKLSRNHGVNRGSKFKLFLQKKPLEGSRIVLWFHQQRIERMAVRDPHKENLILSNKKQLIKNN